MKVVVVGSGAAGVAVAENLRRRDFTGPIAIIGEESGRPYDRPPLSKQVLAGTWPPERTALLADQRQQDLGVTWHLGQRASRLDQERKVLVVDDGAELGYDHLVVATGVTPRTIPAFGLTGVHVLRTLDQALALKEHLIRGARLVVVGGGFLGLEAAATACTLGIAVTVVEPLERPLASRLSHPVAERLVRLHDARGVRILTGVGVAALHGADADPGVPAQGSGSETEALGAVRAVELTDGRLLDVDVVLVSIGCRPSVDWLERSGLTLDDGIVCDEFCCAGDGVWAAGDVSRWFHPRLGRYVRLEHRINANEQGRAVAKNIVGAQEPFSPIPFFWTDHFEVKIQVWGVIPPEAEPVVGTKDDVDSDSFAMRFEDPDDGRLVGALGWNAAGRMAAYRKEIAEAW